jgi:hypothetical protein
VSLLILQAARRFFGRRRSCFLHEEVKVDDGLHAPQAACAANLAA